MSTPDETARLSVDAMWRVDRASQSLGIAILAAGPGFATIAMPVTAEMLNGHGNLHGGFLFALADSAFAFACNSYGERAVAAQCSIAYLRPGVIGMQLVATAREVSRAGRSGIYDVQVKDGDNVIAEFRGHCRVIGGPVAGP